MKKLLLLVGVLGFSVSASAECFVNDPSGTPLNVRYTPNGKIARQVAKGEQLHDVVYTSTIGNILQLPVVKDAKGRDWQYVALSNPEDMDQESAGWVLASLIRCD